MTLYLVATPIGNMGDITLRALDTLRAVDLVASEDTRKTGLLLKHFDIKKPQMSFHEHNEERAGEKIMALLEQGQSVALVTNAGTPGLAPAATFEATCTSPAAAEHRRRRAGTAAPHRAPTPTELRSRTGRSRRTA